MVFTFAHLIIYVYVNVSSIIENWQDYAQPMIGRSSLTAVGNLILRLLGNLIAFIILGLLPLGVRTYANSLNQYLSIMQQFKLLGIDVLCIYRRVFYVSFFISLVQAAFLLFSFWHAIHFYELITSKEAPYKYYLVVVLSSYYKAMFIFFGSLQLYAVFMISNQLNKFLMDFVEEYQKKYENKKILKCFNEQLIKN